MVALEPIHADIENDRLEGVGETPASLEEKPASPAKLKPIG